MRISAIIPAWWRILRGYRPFLSVEITKQCPLRCPGCYAFHSTHLNNGRSVRDLSEWQGDHLIRKVIDLVRRTHPLHVSFVGGEPLLREEELTAIIGRLEEWNIEVQVVTSAVRPIPDAWAAFTNLHMVVSVDGLLQEHNARRSPATYDRILNNIGGHKVIIHCTILPEFLDDPDYLRNFAKTWSAQSCARKIWFSLFTPQRGDCSSQRLTAKQRESAINRIDELRALYPKIHAPGLLLEGMRHPPESPSECIFAQITECVAADLATPIVPCQIGGQPECAECGCVAAAGFAGLGAYRLGGLLKVSRVFTFSQYLASTSKPLRQGLVHENPNMEI